MHFKLLYLYSSFGHANWLCNKPQRFHLCIWYDWARELGYLFTTQGEDEHYLASAHIYMSETSCSKLKEKNKRKIRWGYCSQLEIGCGKETMLVVVTCITDTIFQWENNTSWKQFSIKRTGSITPLNTMSITPYKFIGFRTMNKKCIINLCKFLSDVSGRSWFQIPRYMYIMQ